MRTESTRAWSGLDPQFTAHERALFSASTWTAIGNGQTAKFWEDRWIHGCSVYDIALLIYDCIPKQRRKSRTVADGLQGNSWARDIHGNLGIHEVGQYLQLWHVVANIALSTEPGRLIWRWNTAGTYSAKSCYLA